MKDFPWFKHYPASVEKEVNCEAYSSVADLFDESVEKYKDAVAYECMGKTLSFNQVNEYSAHFAAYLTEELKLKKGSRVAIQMPNILQYPVVMFGALRAGMVVVNTNPLYTSSEMKHQFNDSGADVIVIVANFAYNLEKILHEIPAKHVIVTELGDMLGGFKGTLVNLVVKHIKKMVPAYSIPNAVSLKSTLSKGAKHSFKKPKISLQDTAFLQYTGGTTGVSKGAELTHGNIVANMQQISAWMKPKLKEREEIVITALPLYHIFALTVNCLAMLKIGAHNLLITNPRDMKAFCKDLSKHQFTVFTGVNTLFNGLLNQEAFLNLDFSKLKIAVGGGMAVQKVTAEKWKKVTGVPLAEGYGLTETAPVATCNPIDGTERIGTIGIPLPNTEVMIANDEGEPLGLGERGEILIKGPQVMKGYWNRPEETANVMHGEWFKSGDIGVMDEDGFFKIVDRKKEMILVSGFNVYPNEVEDCIASCPGVLEVGVIGMPDPKSTEKVVAYVVAKDQSLKAEAVIAHCHESLTNYKIPKEVYFTDELPKSNVGKILRRKIKEAHIEKHGDK
ncbi:MAG TPA: long-chain-fatty-acid--CoA ligase [Algoriphagus sp.]|uniref:AMP-binding protein n=1 Tax=unclassified Algoriphagus TaxID=2641541 RepID=UPI000C62F571|nr:MULTISPECIES: AMP-binding protein [unclassified Algoriphagus]MAL14749.1 long-chain-fatty-acid--CoA ligase [Algoriphagus sp.]HAH38933.1 long-chain-fatty-acid--CoA ligase [Algoriphagus sp.]HAS57699.1 long-chain-fatty-acid--CoA ligase [Algoriphagus sp.]HAZ23758.1 long-chain-fatty-acid--CoA ligase [Algoriphagus sp.]HCD87173.1 long-chain-fatty-acid--CoA ligase [Algoriphagus sp.]|tara:strand:+ start:172 stop:1857 length:1686 start_codon:yes stop_codon:yes gene_type:complete